jgi:threonine dehydrogenase-like Zn-dependent dehydrogenase
MEFGDTVLVQGVGPLGIFAVAFAKFFGASKIQVIVSDVSTTLI